MPSDTPSPWIVPITKYFDRDKMELGPMVLITVVCSDGSRKVVEGYHTGNEWWLSGMSPDDYASTPLEDCVGTPIAYRELPPPYDGPVVHSSQTSNVVDFPTTTHRKR